MSTARVPIPVVPLLVAAAVALGAAPDARAGDDGAPSPPAIACDGHEHNLQTYLRMHAVLFTERDVARVGEFYAPEVLSHDRDRGGGAHVVKLADLAAMWAASKKNDPARVLDDDLIICQGPYVVVRTTARGSDRAGFAGNPPTGRPYAISGIDIYRFENGKVVERWGNLDLAGLLKQIGYSFTPPPATPATSQPSPTSNP